jgi:hypothetical protein
LAAETFWDNLSLENEERIKRFQTMINDSESYRWSDIQAEFGTIAGFDEIAVIL